MRKSVVENIYPSLLAFYLVLFYAPSHRHKTIQEKLRDSKIVIRIWNILLAMNAGKF